ncbi:MAG: hypothetical protein JOZ53_11020, partial [Planctomycetaceae bacterium]|nr:hypothetical protein [Planctomycetaceae bacterium]
MRMTSRKMLGWAFVALLTTGCDTAPPGAGLVNSDPATLKAEEKPAARTDLPTPDLAGKDDALAETAASSPAASGTDAGTGGRDGGQGGTRPRRTNASAIGPGVAKEPSATPSRIETGSGNNAQG